MVLEFKVKYKLKGNQYMGDINLCFIDGKEALVESGTTIKKVIDTYKLDYTKEALLAKIDKDYYELNTQLEKGGKFEIVKLDSDIGAKTYARSLQFVMIKAVYDLFKGAKIDIEHSLSKGIFGEINKEKPLSEKDLIGIRERMKEIIDKDREYFNKKLE